MKGKLIIKSIKFALRILPITFWIVLIFAFDEPYVAILTLIAALTHELGHICALIHYSKKYRLFGVASGFRLSSFSHLSYDEELTVALCGPIANLFAFLLASPFILLGGGEYAAIFGIINLFTAISNLIPIEGYDGYRIAECFFLGHTSIKFPRAFFFAFSFFLSAVFSLIGLYLIRSFDGGYWIFFIFLASLFKAITSDCSVFDENRHKKHKF